MARRQRKEPQRRSGGGGAPIWRPCPDPAVGSGFGRDKDEQRRSREGSRRFQEGRKKKKALESFLFFEFLSICMVLKIKIYKDRIEAKEAIIQSDERL
ncbi:hypothetical protein COCNU_01G001290 [Cocos nucifera]|uniref:Uncharacterized protein n=1 Tax=Cocos nucifera TaxID=13894 RepID=A0A8K0HU24_COCNU|nr:hypothetical protein COCNU_01G001290 [Cocos nucifera]